MHRRREDGRARTALSGLDGSIGAVYLKLLGSCDGCPSSAVTLRMAVERAIVEAAPEIVTIDVDEPSQQGSSTPVELGRKVPYEEFDPATGCGVVLTSPGFGSPAG